MTANPRPPTPAGFTDFYRALAEIAHTQEIERRKQERLIVEVADEIEREEPPPPQLKPGVEVLGGRVFIEEGAVQ